VTENTIPLLAAAVSTPELILFAVLGLALAAIGAAATTLPGLLESGGVVISMIAQSGSLGTCRALFK
jgi:hypothetical protein